MHFKATYKALDVIILHKTSLKSQFLK